MQIACFNIFKRVVDENALGWLQIKTLCCELKFLLESKNFQIASLSKAKFPRDKSDYLVNLRHRLSIAGTAALNDKVEHRDVANDQRALAPFRDKTCKLEANVLCSKFQNYGVIRLVT